MENILIPIAFFAAVFGIVYILVSARNKERMALIESGANPEIFKSKFKVSQYNMFKWGLFLVGIAIGIIVGNVLTEGGMNEEVAFSSMILLFGGLSLIVSYLLRNKLNKGDE